ncbi:RDD family protein [Anaplasmataceae bacterium AB001_6]|nr:RDD family protein [Anaplasmataceae bacterium AB001_6]
MDFIIAPIYKRVCAWIIDNIIVFVISIIFSSFVLYLLTASEDVERDYTSFAATSEWYIIFVKIIVTAINISYFTFTVSSKKQATLGQIFCSIYVTGFDGKKIDKMKAFDRYAFQFLIFILLSFVGNYVVRNDQILFSLLYLVLHILLFGWYFLALFNDKRMTIHDWICKTVVVSGRAYK